MMSFWNKIQARDVVAVVALLCCFYLLSLGIDSFVAAITTAIIGYYFSKRAFEETTSKQ